MAVRARVTGGPFAASLRPRCPTASAPSPSSKASSSAPPHPRDHAALSASAGTGKTHVLTARVLRLLLAGVDPASILCLTFTKAGAAEMAERIHRRLAYWVRLKDADLGKELFALGEDPRPGDAGPGAHPVRPGARRGRRRPAHPDHPRLRPGPARRLSRPRRGWCRASGRSRGARSSCSPARRSPRCWSAPRSRATCGLIRDLQALSLGSARAAPRASSRPAPARPTRWRALGPREGVEARLRRAFGLPLGDIDEAIAARMRDDVFDRRRACARIGRRNRAWGTTTGLARLRRDRRLAGAEPAPSAAGRARRARRRRARPRRRRSAQGRRPACSRPSPIMRRSRRGSPSNAARRLLRDARARRRWSPRSPPGCAPARPSPRAYAAAKRAAGVVDFDDLIRLAERLLLDPRHGRLGALQARPADRPYPGRRGAGHQRARSGTSSAPWPANISPARARRGGTGTIFTVGDYKQAIFGFQGTDPASFDVARAWFAREARAIERDFLDLSMDLSFRSSPPILAVGRPGDRRSRPRGARPAAPRPTRTRATMPSGPARSPCGCPFSEESGGDEEAGEEGWISDAVAALCGAARAAGQRLARQAVPCSRAAGRPLRPEDILILVRRRGELAALLVARLHAEGVPVAGVDRLLLSAPLAVQDLLAAARFAAQPLDDLNLAALLVSPLFGWSQDELFDAALRPRRARSGRICARASTPERLEGLQSILAMADYRDAARLLRDDPVGAARRPAQAAGAARRRGARSDRGIALRARSSSRATPPPRCRPSSTGSRAARSRSSAIPPRRSTRCG